MNRAFNWKRPACKNGYCGGLPTRYLSICKGVECTFLLLTTCLLIEIFKLYISSTSTWSHSNGAHSCENCLDV